MPLSIKNKIILASLATISLVVWLAVFLLKTQSDLVAQMGEVIQKNLAATRASEQLKHHFMLYDNLVFRYLATDNEALLSEGAAVQERLKEWLEKMKGLTEGSVEQELLSEIEKEGSRFLNT